MLEGAGSLVNTARSDTSQKSQATEEGVSVILLKGRGWKDHVLWDFIYIKCLEGKLEKPERRSVVYRKKGMRRNC